MMRMRQMDHQINEWAAQEEMRQIKFEQRCSAAPKCDCCGNSVYYFESCLNINEQFYCEECVDSHMELTRELLEDA